jgi:hypothetical protein
VCVNQLLRALALRMILCAVYRQARGPTRVLDVQRLVLKLLAFRAFTDFFSFVRKTPAKLDQFRMLSNDLFSSRVTLPGRYGDASTFRRQPAPVQVDKQSIATKNGIFQSDMLETVGDVRKTERVSECRTPAQDRCKSLRRVDEVRLVFSEQPVRIVVARGAQLFRSTENRPITGRQPCAECRQSGVQQIEMFSSILERVGRAAGSRSVKHNGNLFLAENQGGLLNRTRRSRYAVRRSCKSVPELFLITKDLLRFFHGRLHGRVNVQHSISFVNNGLALCPAR